jgi:hypothetical protein
LIAVEVEDITEVLEVVVKAVTLVVGVMLEDITDVVEVVV